MSRVHRDFFMSEHEKYLKRTFELAEKGRGYTSPNPVVGAVIVRDGAIISEGWHQLFGAEHAEVMALKVAGERARSATLYVNLEPCCFHGKTPPCTDAIIEAGIAEVVIATLDPNPRVNGAGVQRLESAGIKVVHGIAADQARQLNRGFFKLVTDKRPWMTLKLALTIDGFIADVTGKSKWITGELSRNFVHQQRQQHDAVLVGLGTLFKDDPTLLPDDHAGYIPYRMVIDENLHIPFRMNLISDQFHTRTIVLTGSGANQVKIREFTTRGIKVVAVPKDEFGWINLPELFRILGEMGVTSVYCEGGSQLAGSLLMTKLVDEIQLFIAPKILGEGLRAFSGLMQTLDTALQVQWEEVRQLESDLLLRGRLS